MKPIKAWAVYCGGTRPAIEWTAEEARETKESWEDYDGRNVRVFRVEIREVPAKARKGER